jgi:hypothetical protein
MSRQFIATADRRSKQQDEAAHAQIQNRVLAGFKAKWPELRLRVAGFVLSMRVLSVIIFRTALIRGLQQPCLQLCDPNRYCLGAT